MSYKDYIKLFLITWLATTIVSFLIFKLINDCKKDPMFASWKDLFSVGILTGFIPALLFTISFGELLERANRIVSTMKMLN